MVVVRSGGAGLAVVWWSLHGGPGPLVVAVVVVVVVARCNQAQNLDPG